MIIFVGSHNLELHDQEKDLSFPVLVLYPTQVPSKPVAFGPYSIELSPDAVISGASLPLVIISHGGGSSHLVYRSIAFHLAKSGYIVAMPEHAGDNRSNHTLSGRIENAEYRPRHIRLTIDAITASLPFKDHLRRDKVAIIGHSMGGYTALAVAGGQPWWGVDQKIEVMTDPRVKALVLMAPATSWFVPNDSLQGVTAPILLLAAEHDTITPRWQAQLVLDLVPKRTQVTFKIIENAGHFSFLSPFPAPMRRPDFLPASDPEGFDRELFHKQLNEELLIFLNKNLT